MAQADDATGKISQAIIDFLIVNIPIFSDLSDFELKLIEKHLELITVNPSRVVFKEGEKGDYVFFVIDGSLEVVKRSETDEEFVLTTLARGRSIGEMAVIDELPRSATVRACTKSTLLILSRNDFNDILAEHTAIGVKILKGIARLLSLNLRKTSSRLMDHMLPLG